MLPNFTYFKLLSSIMIGISEFLLFYLLICLGIDFDWCTISFLFIVRPKVLLASEKWSVNSWVSQTNIIMSSSSLAK